METALVLTFDRVIRRVDLRVLIYFHHQGKIEFLEMTVDNLQTLLVNKEQEKKEVVALERTSVESMKKQMRDYIKKHAEANMDKDRTIVKLEKEAETLKKVGIERFLGATKHLCNWLCPLVCRVTHSFDDPHVAPYWPTWPCYSTMYA